MKTHKTLSRGKVTAKHTTDEFESLPITAVRKMGEKVTTIDRHGGIGIGYLLDGKVWKSTGSYFAVLAKKDVGGMTRFIRDGGNGYRNAVKKLLGGS